MKLFCLYDNASGTYDVPRVFQSRAAAHRSMVSVFEDGKQEAIKAGVTWVRWPENFSLFEVGDFDPSTSKITPRTSPDLCFNLWELAAKVDHAGSTEPTE